MPVYRVEFRPAALRSLESLSQKLGARLYARAESLGANPYPVGVKKLRGSELHRGRFGDYRIVHAVKGAALLGVAVRIGTRGEVYRGL